MCRVFTGETCSAWFTKLLIFKDIKHVHVSALLFVQRWHIFWKTGSFPSPTFVTSRSVFAVKGEYFWLDHPASLYSFILIGSRVSRTFSSRFNFSMKVSIQKNQNLNFCISNQVWHYYARKTTHLFNRFIWNFKYAITDKGNFLSCCQNLDDNIDTILVTVSNIRL